MTGQRPNVSERGQVVLLIAIALPMILAMSAVVAGVGNWWVHGKNLQTKADAGALAGGGEWAFPCGPEIDARIAATARLYAGSSNPQVGGVPNTSIHPVLNGTNWYDDDDPLTPPGPADFTNPSGSVCEAVSLDVKVTEDNSFPLLSLIPLFPDIKRRAKVELKEIESTGGEHLLPIAVRAPVPVSAAVYYNEANGTILDVKYFVEEDLTGPPPNPVTGLPAGLQGWTTNNPEDASTWASFTPAGATGVAIAISFRGACDTNLPSSNTNIPVQAGGGPCFEDEFVTVSQLCNQGPAQIVDCHYATGNAPTQTVQAGLHFIRGYANLNPNQGGTVSDPPAVESAWLDNVDCTTNGYFNALPNSATDCEAELTVSVDVGNLVGDYGAAGSAGDGPLRAQDIEVRFRLVRGDGSAQCNYGNNCDLISGGQAPTLTYSTQGNSGSPHLQLDANTRQNAVAVQVRLKNVVGHPNADCLQNSTFRDNCRWFYTGSGLFGTGVAPTNAQILASPVQRAFRGNSVNSTSVQWLRVTTDSNCAAGVDFIDGEAASQPTGSAHCFKMDMGLKGGLAKSANEPALVFDDGTGSSQTGTLDCDPNVPQGQALEDSIRDGCGPWYARHSFNVSPLCPQQNSIFDQPNPGPPWSDWPPIQCVKTRPTGAANQFQKGFEERFFNGGSSCPSAGPGFVKGRNYWDKDTPNGFAGIPPLGYKDGSHDTRFNPADPRIVTIFLVPTWTFTGSGQDTYPIAGFVQVYITGYGRLNGSGNLTIDDPCPGNTPPPASDYACGGSSCGYIVWGHFIKYSIPSPNATPDPEVDCDPEATIQPCVAVLVE